MTALFKSPKAPVQKIEAPVQTPTIDDAQRNRNETDRLRKRRGVAGNLFAGMQGSAVGEGTAPGKTLTGS